jgi:hypothetical protein
MAYLPIIEWETRHIWLKTFPRVARLLAQLNHGQLEHIAWVHIVYLPPAWVPRLLGWTAEDRASMRAVLTFTPLELHVLLACFRIPYFSYDERTRWVQTVARMSL